MKQSRFGNAATGLALAGCAIGTWAALAEDFGRPGPGRYRVDAETTLLTGQGAMVFERLQKVDGATGQLTLTTKGPPGSGPPVVQVFKAEKPNEHCVRSGALAAPPSVPPIALLPLASLPNAPCWQVGPPVTANGGSQSIDCKGVQMKQQWRRLGDANWEMTLEGTQDPIPGVDISSAVRAAMARLTPEQVAKLDPAAAKVAAGGSMADAMAPAIAAMEARTRQGTPAEQAEARLQLDTFRRSMGIGTAKGAPAVPVVRIRHREVWTRISGACTPG